MTHSAERLSKALAHRYRIQRELGAGGMAIVYLARDLKHERDVAIKVLRPELALALGTERFLGEIQMTAKLQSPHILPLFDSGEIDGFVYYVMPFVDGESLRARIDREGALPLETALSIATDVAAALAHAHAAGIVHRDIKPENVLLKEDEALVADFGIALAVTNTDRQRLTATGLSIGTPNYMSPEQMGDEHLVDHRTDVYALGCVLYEMLTGRLPFTGHSVQAIVARMMTDAPPPIRSSRPDVPKSVEAAIEKALAKDPADRFDTARAFADALQISRGAEPRRRMSGVLLAIMGTAVLGLAWFGWRSAQVSDARESLAHISALASSGSYVEAYNLARSAERYLGEDSTLSRLMAEVSDILSIQTEPSGASVRIERFPEDSVVPPQTIGVTPIVGYRIPRVDHRVVVTLEGFAPVERIATSTYGRTDLRVNGRDISFDLVLHPVAKVPEGMVPVPGGDYALTSPDAPLDLSAMLDDFFIDRFEVTNEAFQRFVAEGGYTRDQLWTDVPAAERHAMVDRTGLPGPRRWSRQTFPAGYERHPVTDVTWYEARAYCASRGIRLPTVFEWEKTSRNGLVSPTGMVVPWGVMTALETTAPRANLNSDGTMPVDAYPFGISPYGAHAMAGNVKEWLANTVDGEPVVTGASWEDPAYLSTEFGSRPPTLTSPALGFRCARSAQQGGGDQGAGDIQLDVRTPVYTPVDNATFQSLLGHYRYDPRPANARSAGSFETESWTRERIWIDGLNGDSILLYLYIPSQATPPYQTIVHVPGSSVFCCESLPEETEWVIGPVIQSGRAVLAVVLRGMVERRHPLTYTPPATNSVRFRDEMVHHATELRLGIDYLQERGDIDLDRMAYVSLSWGAGSRLAFAGIDDRYKAVVFIGGGIDERVKPVLPEADNVNFAPRIGAPKLLLNGRQDEEHPWLSRALPLWNLLSEPKELALVDGAGHVPPLEVRIPAINRFLDGVLGPVRQLTNDNPPPDDPERR